MFGRPSVAISFPIAEMLGFHSCRHFFPPSSKTRSMQKNVGNLGALWPNWEIYIRCEKGIPFLGLFWVHFFFWTRCLLFVQTFHFLWNVIGGENMQEAEENWVSGFGFTPSFLLPPSLEPRKREQNWGTRPKKAAHHSVFLFALNVSRWLLSKYRERKGKERKRVTMKIALLPRSPGSHDTATFSYTIFARLIPVRGFDKKKKKWFTQPFVDLMTDSFLYCSFFWQIPAGNPFRRFHPLIAPPQKEKKVRKSNRELLFSCGYKFFLALGSTPEKGRKILGAKHRGCLAAAADVLISLCVRGLTVNFGSHANRRRCGKGRLSRELARGENSAFVSQSSHGITKSQRSTRFYFCL